MRENRRRSEAEYIEGGVRENRGISEREWREE